MNLKLINFNNAVADAVITYKPRGVVLRVENYLERIEYPAERACRIAVVVFVVIVGGSI